MKLSLPLLLSGALSVAISASADNIDPIEGMATGISPDASSVVGIQGRWDTSKFSSFRYTVADGKMEWLTDGEAPDHLAGGSFAAITDSGLIAGEVRNPGMRLPVNVNPYSARPVNDVEEEGEPISSAAIWRGGKLYVLGCGPYTIDSFTDVSDGSSAIGLSADGNIVFGNIMSSWMAIEGCIWEYDEATGSYDYRPLRVPSNAQMSSVVATAADGFPAIGAISIKNGDEGFMLPALWLSVDEFVNVNVPDMTGANGVYAHSISADGRYMSVSVAGSHPAMYIYDVTEGTFEEVTLPAGTTEATGYTITNDGNIILKVQDSNWQTNLYYYDHASDSMVTLAEYLADTLDYTLPEDTSSVKVIATTGDGKNLLIQTNSYSSESLLLTMDNPQLKTCPAPDDLTLYHVSPAEVELRFKGIASLPAGCELKGYKVFVDNAEVSEIEASELGGEYTVKVPGESGTAHRAYVRTIYVKDGKTALSGSSPVVADYVSADTSLLCFYDFDDAVMDSQGNFYWNQDGWQAKVNYGVPGQFVSWYITVNDFENRTPAVSVVSAADERWSNVFVSHFMDAKEAKDFYIDFRYQMRLVNTPDQDLATDYLDVEASTDGREWITVGTINAAEVTPAVWHTAHFDLGEKLAGKLFQLRLNAHGEGIGQLLWSVDEIAVADKFEGEQPDGLRFRADEKQMKLMWHNNLGMHDLSYVANSSILWDFNAGNEGDPMISAIELSSDMMEPFAGEYISAVSTFIFDDPNVAQPVPTKAEAIVYVDGEEVARTPFDSQFDVPEQSVVWLENPVLIESGKTYRVGVRISDYDPDQSPMYYQAAPGMIEDVTDLFSEDDGRTWDSASDFLVSEENPDGLCIWPIRAHISPEPVKATEASDVIFFDVFRDGEKINEGNVYEPHPYVTVPYPYEGVYNVQAHYKGGMISPLSDPVKITHGSGVKEVSFTLGVSTGHGTIAISGDCKGATLYDMSGRVVAATAGNHFNGIPAGVYILNAMLDNGTETYKIVVK
ncbi:MAG: T9SS type A sorting domain-containing protein [Muribaculaceae bacterium]|nr:T9SS type A sorting domain-containing protein [Muribaculaceae bacterium]